MSDENAGSVTQVLYTVDEAARMLRVKPRWLRRKAAARKVPFHMLARSYRFSARDLDEIMRMHAVPPAEEEPSGIPRHRAHRHRAAVGTGTAVSPLGPRPSPRRLARDLAKAP